MTCGFAPWALPGRGDFLGLHYWLQIASHEKCNAFPYFITESKEWEELLASKVANHQGLRSLEFEAPVLEWVARATRITFISTPQPILRKALKVTKCIFYFLSSRLKFLLYSSTRSCLSTCPSLHCSVLVTRFSQFRSISVWRAPLCSGCKVL